MRNGGYIPVEPHIPIGSASSVISAVTGTWGSPVCAVGNKIVRVFGYTGPIDYNDTHTNKYRKGIDIGVVDGNGNISWTFTSMPSFTRYDGIACPIDSTRFLFGMGYTVHNVQTLYSDLYIGTINANNTVSYVAATVSPALPAVAMYGNLTSQLHDGRIFVIDQPYQKAYILTVSGNTVSYVDLGSLPNATELRGAMMTLGDGRVVYAGGIANAGWGDFSYRIQVARVVGNSVSWVTYTSSYLHGPWCAPCGDASFIRYSSVSSRLFTLREDGTAVIAESNLPNPNGVNMFSGTCSRMVPTANGYHIWHSGAVDYPAVFNGQAYALRVG